MAWVLRVRENIHYNAPNCLRLKTKQNRMHGVLCWIKMTGFLVEGQITFLKHCKALLLHSSNDCDYILLPNSDEFIGFLGVLLPTQKETNIQTGSKLNWYTVSKSCWINQYPNFNVLITTITNIDYNIEVDVI